MQVEGAEAAELYQTYGVPPEVFDTMAQEKQLQFDWDGFRTAMEEHGEASGKVSHTVMGASGPLDELKQSIGSTAFVGYERVESSAKVLGIVAGERRVTELSGRRTGPGRARPNPFLW